MRLGIVMMGTGAYAAANAGVLRALEVRGITPYAVCGMDFGAWIAAMHLCGMDAVQIAAVLSDAARHGEGLMGDVCAARAVLRGKRAALCEGKKINRLLCEQTGEQLLSLCDRRGIFLCRAAVSGRHVIFSTRAYAQGSDAALTLQATAAFAARAVMAQPPLLSPMQWLGSALIAEEDPSYAAGQLMRMGADGVLMIEPRASVSHEQDALELASAGRRWALEERTMEGAGVLRVMMPANTSALRFKHMVQITEAGFSAAQTQLDAVLSAMGVEQCRVIPFKKRSEHLNCR